MLKKSWRFLKNKTNNHLQVYETFSNSKPCDFIGDQCNEIGLNEGILDIFQQKEKVILNSAYN